MTPFSQSLGLGSIPGIMGDRSSSLHIPTHRLFIQPPATCPKPKELALEGTVASSDTVEFLMWLSVTLLGLFPFLFYWLMAPPLWRLKHLEETNFSMEILCVSQECHWMVTVSPFRVPFTMIFSHHWRTEVPPFLGGGTSSITVPDEKPLHGSLSYEICKRTSLKFYTHTSHACKGTHLLHSFNDKTWKQPMKVNWWGQFYL